MNRNKLIMFTLFVLCFFCLANKCTDTKEPQETIFEREERLISEYHKQVIISKGDSSFFIPKAEISWYLDKEKFIDTSLAKIGDNISFFDTSGNIIYQALLVDIINNKKIIRCQGVKTAEYYLTELSIDSIRNLNTRSVKDIRAYRW